MRSIGGRLFLRAAAALAAALLVPACGGSGGGSGPPPVYPAAQTVDFANRTSGVAPLAVFFSAAQAVMNGTGAPIVQPLDDDFGAMHYRWDFGDPGAGTWATTGRSKNADTGMVAAHVYETPGTYTAQLTLTDATGVSVVYAQTITVGAFAGTTYYVAAAGDDLNPGTDPALPWRTIAKVFQNLGPHRRFLFRRGDTFATNALHTVNVPGPTIFGAYGAGARPVVQTTGNDTCLQLRTEDCRVMDLEFVGPGGANVGNAVSLNPQLGVHRNLILRVRASGFQMPIGWFEFPTMYATPHDGNAVVECEVPSGVRNAMFVGGARLAVLGNTLENPSFEHVLRVWQMHRGVIAHNILRNPSVHALKLHGPTPGDGRFQSRYIQVSDNLIRGRQVSAAVGPQDNGQNELLEDVVVERNRFTAAPTVQFDLAVWAGRTTVRNNVFDATGAHPTYTAVVVARRGVEPPPRRVGLLHNTFYRGDASTEFIACRVGSECSGVVLSNLIASAPLSSTRWLRFGSCPGLVETNVLLTDVPGFANAAGGDFTLTAGSPGRDTGALRAEGRTDIMGVARPQGAQADLGAFEQ